MIMKIVEDRTNINNFINFIKNTYFFKEVVESLYLDNNTNTVYYKPKKSYTKREEITLWDELDKTDFPYMIEDISIYEGDILNLKLV